MPNRTDGYFLTIPGSVYEDANLSDAEKLFFALVSGLTVERGYCYASDEYLARRTGKNPRSVRRIVSALEDADHLRTETTPKTNGAGGRERRIYIKTSYLPKEKGVQDTGNASNLHLHDAEAFSAGGYRTPGEGTGQKCPEPSEGSGQKCPGVQDKNVRSYIEKNKEEEYITTQNSSSIPTVEAGLSELEDATTGEDRKEWEGERFWSDQDEEKNGNAIRDFLTMYDTPDPIAFSWAWKRAFGFQPPPFIKTSLYVRAFSHELTKEQVRERWEKLIAAVAVCANAGLSGSPGSIEYVLKSWKENPPGGKKAKPGKRVPLRFYKQADIDRFKEELGAIPADFVAWRHESGAFLYALSEDVRPFVVNKLIDLDLPTIRVSDWPEGLSLIYPSTKKEEVAA